MKKISSLVGFLFISFFLSFSGAEERETESFINPAVPDFFGTAVAEVDGNPEHFVSGFTISIDGVREFVTAGHLLIIDDDVRPEDITYRMFLKDVTVISDADPSVSHSTGTDLARIRLRKDGPAVEIGDSVRVGDILTLYGTGDISPDKFRGVTSYYGDEFERELWQHSIRVVVTRVDVPAADIDYQLGVSAPFARGFTPTYIGVRPLDADETIPGGFSGGVALNARGEAVAMLLGVLPDEDTEILVLLRSVLSRGGHT